MIDTEIENITRYSSELGDYILYYYPDFKEMSLLYYNEAIDEDIELTIYSESIGFDLAESPYKDIDYLKGCLEVFQQTARSMR